MAAGPESGSGCTAALSRELVLAGQWWLAAAAGRKSSHGSGGRATSLVGWQWGNTLTAALLGQEGGGKRAAVLARWQGIGGGEG